MGSLSAKNASEKFSRLGTFNVLHHLDVCEPLNEHISGLRHQQYKWYGLAISLTYPRGMGTVYSLLPVAADASRGEGQMGAAVFIVVYFALQRRFELCIPRNQTARPCSQFPYLYILYSQDLSTYSATANFRYSIFVV